MSKNPNAVEFMSPAGRLVQGSLFIPSKTDMYNRPLLNKKGEPRVNYFISVAIPKKDVSFVNNQLIPHKAIQGGYVLNWALVLSVASKLFPSYFPGGKCVYPTFSFKITDGDSEIPNAKGVKPKDRDGWAGCWIIRFNNGFAPKIFTRGGKTMITDPNAIKPGYWIRVHGTCAGNNNMEKPGVFLNMTAVELVGAGEEIHFGDSGDAFSADPADLPEGASEIPTEASVFTPPMSGNTPPPPMPGNTPPPPLPTNVMPAPDFLTPKPGLTSAPVTLPPPPPGSPTPASMQTPPPPVAVKYIANGNVYTAEELKKSGWQESQILGLPKA
jgi:hypothetical protein